MTATTAEEKGGVLEYELRVDAKLDYLVWLHFAEIEGRVRRVGGRVFDVYINGDNLTRVDIYKQVGGFAAFTWHHTEFELLNGNLLEGQVPEQLYSIGVHGGAIEYVNLIQYFYSLIF
ncbi:hypothetical protein V8G54_015057 [Vigna mungo]|uniref:Malectin domain-containing protein n=1 Tax=Vigna mungo TaxID=3915 RepID=A0AAQ3NJJ3_VIGMU